MPAQQTEFEFMDERTKLSAVFDKAAKYGFDRLDKADEVAMTLELIGCDHNPGFECLRDLFDAPERKLKEKLTDQQITRLQAMREISVAHMAEEMKVEPIKFDSPFQVKGFLRKKLGHDSSESICVIFLDIRNQFIECDVRKGTVDHAIVYPREIVKRALEVDASGIILAHNHPSNVCDPSRHDVQLTKRVKEAAKAVDIRFLDHIIVGKTQDFSFVDAGMMEEPAEYGNSQGLHEKKERVIVPVHSTYV